MPQFKAYFNTKTLSDVTLQYGDYSMPAHKLVLAQGSDYFKSCFEGRFSESQSSTLTLKDDPVPTAVFHIIGALYGEQAYDLDALSTLDDPTAAFMHIVDIYVAAGKYLIPQLSAQILADFPTMLQHVHAGPGYNGKLELVIRHIYVDRADAASELRSSIVKHLVKYIKGWTVCPEFKALLADLPDLAFELIVAIAAPKVPSEEKKVTSTTSGDKKRRKQVDADSDDDPFAASFITRIKSSPSKAAVSSGKKGPHPETLMQRTVPSQAARKLR